ncbi:hypothetical protein CYMTET_4613, partial [Cymbomonas tetramitiformis]
LSAGVGSAHAPWTAWTRAPSPWWTAASVWRPSRSLRRCATPGTVPPTRSPTACGPSAASPAEAASSRALQCLEGS